MTAPLGITTNQMVAIVRAAQKTGTIPEFKIGQTVVRLIHKDDPQASRPIAEKEIIL